MALWQHEPTGEWRKIQCFSRHITPTESRPSATEIELLAIVWAVKKAHLYLACAELELIVDHRPLIPIIYSKKLDEFSTPRIVRMREELASYQIIAVRRPGTKHTIVDCFSCYPTDHPTEEDMDSETEVEQVCHLALLIEATDHDTEGVICADIHLYCAEGRKDYLTSH